MPNYGQFCEKHKGDQMDICRLIHDYAEKAYKEGLTEAWDYARKIADIDFDCVQVFDVPFKNDVFTNFDVQEAMAKIIKYERQKHTDKSCDSCKYEDEPEFANPCVDCSRNHKDMWEAKR
jgi:hypothetical protein